MTNNEHDKRIIQSEFAPASWLRNRHAQTVYPSFPWAFRHRPKMRREELELPDGDVTAIDWLVQEATPPRMAPLLVILHGLEGSAKSSYARMMMREAAELGWHCCVMHFRDCGDYTNRLPRRYHAGETNDVRFFLNELEASEQYGPIVAVGYSLGGNVLLKYLGESADSTPLRAATAVCAPLNLHKCSEALNSGFSKTYQYYLIKRMKSAVRRKFNKHTAAFDWDRAMAARTFDEFDDAVTAPLHGFDGKQDYYDRCSSVSYLSSITQPTLVINTLDDPFMSPEVIPGAERVSESVTIEVSAHGGHVGFIDGGTPWNPSFYLPARITGFLEAFTARPGM
jgi:predicted alpha/beta-fold hydrolase